MQWYRFGLHNDHILVSPLEGFRADDLIQGKVGQDSLDSAKEVGAALAEACNAFVAQVIGRTILVYRPRDKDPEITLP